MCTALFWALYQVWHSRIYLNCTVEYIETDKQVKTIYKLQSGKLSRWYNSRSLADNWIIGCTSRFQWGFIPFQVAAMIYLDRMNSSWMPEYLFSYITDQHYDEHENARNIQALTSLAGQSSSFNDYFNDYFVTFTIHSSITFLWG